MKPWIKRIASTKLSAGFLTLGLLLGILYAAFAPLPYDAILPEEKWGAGASSVLPAYSGLQRELPAVNGESTPEKTELGRLLFFIPCSRRIRICPAPPAITQASALATGFRLPKVQMELSSATNP